MQHLELVYFSPYDIILTGDFSIDSDQSKINIIETVLNVKQLIKSPPHVTDTTIDHIFTTSPEMHSNSGILPITLRDHYCTYTILDLKSLVNIPKIFKSQNYNKYSASSFLLDILSFDIFNNFHTQTDTCFAWDVWILSSS